MWSFAKFVVFCLIAVAVGLAAVSLPIEGRTPAEYVRGLLESHLSDAGAAEGPGAAPGAGRSPAPRPAAARASQKAPQRGSDRPPADDHSEEDRAGLERLLGERVK